jgi:2-keto-4-pentenoate hydratase
MRKPLASAIAALFLAAHALSADIVETITHCYLKKQTLSALALSMEEALSVREGFVERLTRTLGGPVGYKAALTNPDIQRRFGVNEPIRGVILSGMLLENNSTVAAHFGARGMLEGDLIARVGSENINNAETAEEVLSSIDAVIPFIELPDLMYSADVKPTAAMVVAINAGARFGVLGAPLKEFKNLKDITVEIFDEKNAKLTEGRASSIMGDPVYAILWIRDSLKKEGKTLKKGDLLSLGSITDMVPARAGSTITAVYHGLGREPVEVAVRFSE